MTKLDEIDLKIEIAGIVFRNPLFLAEGPMSGDAALISRAAEHAVGGIVTKSMRDTSYISPSMHMIRANKGLINADWSDIGFDQWLRELDKLHLPVPLITNVATNHVSPRQAAKFAEILQHHGAAMVTFSDYEPENLIEAVRTARKHVSIPIMVKLPPFRKDIGSLCVKLEEAGVNCIAAMDAVGPAMDIDIDRGEPLLRSEDGTGYLSSEPIFPLALAYIAEICRNVSVPVIGVGGVTSYKDVVKMIMAGATGVGISGGVLLHGLPLFDKIEQDLRNWLQHKGYNSISQVRGMIRASKDDGGKSWEIIPEVDVYLCNGCGICERTCFKQAISLKNSRPGFNYSECVRCGLCITSCPKNAILQQRREL